MNNISIQPGAATITFKYAIVSSSGCEIYVVDASLPTGTYRATILTTSLIQEIIFFKFCNSAYFFWGKTIGQTQNRRSQLFNEECEQAN